MDKLRGHAIEYRNGTWVFSDTLQPTAQTWKERPCGFCGLPFTSEGHDGCLGTLPGVMNACCGHGNSNEAYIQMNNGTTIRGKEALTKMKKP